MIQRKHKVPLYVIIIILWKLNLFCFFTSLLCTSRYSFNHNIRVCRCVLPTSKVSLGEEVLDKVCVSRKEQVVQFVYTHADRSVDVQPPAQVGAERLHFTWRSDGKQERFCCVSGCFSRLNLFRCGSTFMPVSFRVINPGQVPVIKHCIQM